VCHSSQGAFLSSAASPPGRLQQPAARRVCSDDDAVDRVGRLQVPRAQPTACWLRRACSSAAEPPRASAPLVARLAAAAAADDSLPARQAVSCARHPSTRPLPSSNPSLPPSLPPPQDGLAPARLYRTGWLVLRPPPVAYVPRPARRLLIDRAPPPSRWRASPCSRPTLLTSGPPLLCSTRRATDVREGPGLGSPQAPTGRGRGLRRRVRLRPPRRHRRARGHVGRWCASHSSSPWRTSFVSAS